MEKGQAEVPGDQYCMFLYIKIYIHTHTRAAASSAVELCNLLSDRLTWQITFCQNNPVDTRVTSVRSSWLKNQSPCRCVFTFLLFCVGQVRLDSHPSYSRLVRIHRWRQLWLWTVKCCSHRHYLTSAVQKLYSCISSVDDHRQGMSNKLAGR